MLISMIDWLSLLLEIIVWSISIWRIISIVIVVVVVAIVIVIVIVAIVVTLTTGIMSVCLSMVPVTFMWSRLIRLCITALTRRRSIILGIWFSRGIWLSIIVPPIALIVERFWRFVSVIVRSLMRMF